MHINLQAPIGGTGYGVAGLNVLRALVARDTKVYLSLMGNRPHVETQAEADVVQAALDMRDPAHYKAPCLKIWHQFELASYAGHGKYAAFPFFELDRFDEREIYNIGFPDIVLVTSQWAKNVVAKYRDSGDIFIVPLGVDPNVFFPSELVKKPRFVVANFGKWEKRKGHDILAEVFNRAFTPKDDVELWMFPSNPFLNELERRVFESKYMTSEMGHRIHIHPRISTHVELASYMAKTDIGIFPARAEGWNLELLEMMAMGKPVIATNYSAHTEYCTPENCTLIDIDKQEVARDGKWFFGQGEWASLGEPQQDAMVEALRAAYKKWQPSDARILNVEGIETARRLTWDNSASIILEVLGR